MSQSRELQDPRRSPARCSCCSAAKRRVADPSFDSFDFKSSSSNSNEAKLLEVLFGVELELKRNIYC